MTALGIWIMFALAFEDIHTFGNVHEVQTSHLSLDLRVDFESETIEGRCAITLAYAAGQSARHVDLDTYDLTILAATDGDGRSLSFEMGDKTVTGRRLRIHLSESQPREIVVRYRTDPTAEALQWLAPALTTSKKHPFLFTQSQSIYARTWIPCMDSPGVRVTYDAVVRVPKGLTAVMSARHGKHEPEKGVFRFELPQAIPPYLIALAVGEIAFQPLSDRTGVYAEPGVLKRAAWEFADMEAMIKATERLYGPYVWGRWDVIVLPPSFPYGGMENPLLTFATPTIIAGDRSLVSLMAHELAHSWSGNLTTNASWRDFWLNEGFTTYIERRIVEAIYGEGLATMQKLLGQRDLRQSLADMKPQDTLLHIDLSGRHPEEGFSDIPYEKGANFLLMLEDHFGRERLDAFLKDYFAEHAFQSMTTAKFLSLLKEKLFRGDEALWTRLKVREWVYEPGLPDNMVVPESDRFDKTRAAAKAFAETGDLSGVKQDAWSTAEWLDFLNGLPEKLSDERLTALDKAFNLSKSGNSEILFAWLINAIRNSYEPAYPAFEDFLTRQGRRKFLKPLYAAAMANPATQDLAKRVYQKARSSYHPISIASVDAIVK